LVQDAQERIIRNSEGQWGIADLAAEMNVSREHLARAFRKELGTSPQNYLLQKKMNLACELLREFGLSCAEVAERLGYDRPSSFSRAFKSVFGTNPQDYRNTSVPPASMPPR